MVVKFCEGWLRRGEKFFKYKWGGGGGSLHYKEKEPIIPEKPQNIYKRRKTPTFMRRESTLGTQA